MDAGPVAAVILAAGLGRRFGGPKADARLHGRTLLSHVVATAGEAGLEPILAVVRPNGAVPPRVIPILNPDPGQGLSSSLRLGIRAVPPDHAALVLLVDQPTMPAATIAALLTERGTHPILAAEAGGRLAPPVLIEPTAFELVEALRGDIGLRAVFRSRPGLVGTVPVGAHPPDVDTAEDLARLEAG